MKCFWCNHEMQPYFIKHFDIKDMENCEYVRCENCGFVISKTYYELSPERRYEINFVEHHKYQGTDYNDVDPTWIERLEYQSTMFVELFQEKIFNTNWRIVDYGAGDGKFANLVNPKIGKHIILNYEPYMTDMISSGGGGESLC